MLRLLEAGGHEHTPLAIATSRGINSGWSGLRYIVIIEYIIAITSTCSLRRCRWIIDVW